MTAATFSKEQISEFKIKYDDLMEEFIDAVFGYDNLITRKVWQQKVATECAWIFSPTNIREKLGCTSKIE